MNFRPKSSFLRIFCGYRGAIFAAIVFRAVRSGVSEKLFALRGALVQAEGLFEAARADSWYIRGACSVVVSLRCVDAGRRNWFNREGFLASPSRHGGVDCVCSVCWGSEGRAFLFGSFL